eukprot:TRINITY_DN51052_c0_g1_i1.p1 TRINITY_DN51052_c0_g1~~TRINITY_DN51052_c0_g1_i1.p1  ORF type:complete len:471 (+),score=104.65 TRINITY_DN51052_c0_g1_i1:136-1548(+)
MGAAVACYEDDIKNISGCCKVQLHNPKANFKDAGVYKLSGNDPPGSTRDFANGTITRRGVGAHSCIDAAAVLERLPRELGAPTMRLVQESLPVIAEKAEAIAESICRKMVLEEHVDLLETTNLADVQAGRKQRCLGAVIRNVAANIDQPDNLQPLVENIASRHAGLGVRPHYFLTLHMLFVAASEEVVGQHWTPQVAAAWSQAMLFFSRLLVEKQNALQDEAKARGGGWQGFRAFNVMKKTRETENVVTLTLKPVEHPCVYFDFAPGQFVSVKVNIHDMPRVTPRHYSIVSPPGLPHLQITVKKLKGGLVSTFLHDIVAVGERVMVSPPFGTFTSVPRCLEERLTPSLVFVSAGIGLASLMPIMEASRGRVRRAVHVDRSADVHALRPRFLEATLQADTIYTSEDGRPPEDLPAKLIERFGAEHRWYVCGPAGFMRGIVKGLLEGGVSFSRLRYQVYAEDLALEFSSGFR